MRVKFVPLQPHCFAFGGFEIQMLETFNAIKKLGVEVEKMDFWDKDDNFDIVHLWGLEIAHLNTILWAKRKNKKVVITALLNYMETPVQKMHNFISSYVAKTKYLKRISEMADSVIVLNDKQKEVAIKYYNSYPEKTKIIPIIINSKYYNYKYEEIKDNYFDLEKFILCTGNVCFRKNQYNLAKACIELDNDLIIIGNILEGEQAYADKLERLIDCKKNIKWLKGVKAADNILLNAYKNCSIFALPSFAEVQPTSAIEAAIAHKPLLLANKAYARQKYFNGAKLVNPSSVVDIKKGIISVTNDPLKFCINPKLFEDFREDFVAKKYLDVYNSII